MIEAFAPANNYKYIRKGNDYLINCETFPTISLVINACGDMGEETIRTIITAQVSRCAAAFGVTPTQAQTEEVVETIMHNAHDFRLSEIVLFFQMMKGGAFRDREGENIAKMYGAFSVAAFADCITAYRQGPRTIAYNNQVAENNRRCRQMMFSTASNCYADRRDAIFSHVLSSDWRTDNKKHAIFKQLLTPEDMNNLEKYAEERRVLMLLKQRVEEYLFSIDSVANDFPDSEESPQLKALRNGVDYYNKKFKNIDNGN